MIGTITSRQHPKSALLRIGFPNYTQAVTEVKREALSRLVGMLLDGKPQNESTTAIGTKRAYEKTIEPRKPLK